MYFLALATDYDGTLAEHGVVDAATITALGRVKESGRRLILITGRELPDLQRVFPDLSCFDLVVAENGALLYEPATGQETVLAAAPPDAFVARLREKGVQPLSVGRSIVATWEPMETAVLATVRELGLELQIIFNKGAVMILPAGVSKASGLAAALGKLRLSPHNVVGVGDAENDHAFLRACGCSVAVANALESVKDEVDLVTRDSRGTGVVELIDLLLETDLAEVERPPQRGAVLIGTLESGEPAYLWPSAGGMLIAGISGGGKSTKVAGILERVEERGFQYCIIDPEGDYAELEGPITLGDAKRSPRVAEARDVLGQPDRNLVLNMLGVELADRPGFFAALLPELTRLRAETGRPHWIVIDEAHHLLPEARTRAAAATMPRDLRAAILVTVHPDQLAAGALATIETVMAVGKDPAQVIVRFCEAAGEAPPEMPDVDALAPDEALLWQRGSGQPPVKVMVDGPHQERHRHVRKYAEGELGPDRSFYFRGPDQALNLRAQNLALFNQIAAGIDDGTWLHHLRSGDYSAWLRDSIKDGDLADEVATVEADDGVTPADSRTRIKAAIDSRYTGPAGGNEQPGQ